MAFTDLPIYTQFHVAIGISAIIFAGFALLVRFPLPYFSRLLNLYGVFGGMYIVLAVFMPITSNWIWPKFGTPYMVIFFISTMFIAIALGIICIKLYKYFNRHEMAYEIVAVHEIPGLPDKIQSRRHVWLKYLHGFFMFYSWVMILGAAGAFGSNARSPGRFPYKATETNQLYGHCYGRNLNETDAPLWLTTLECGFSAWCTVSATDPSDKNPYYQNPN